MLYYFILAHQPDFDVFWCRELWGNRSSGPGLNGFSRLGDVAAQRRVSDVTLDSTGQVSAVVCEEMKYSRRMQILPWG